jgi:membrane dipeptidase
MEVIRDELHKRRYSQTDIDKVMGGNLLRLYADVVG